MGAGSSAEQRSPQDGATAAGESLPSSPETEAPTAAPAEPEQLEDPAKVRVEADKSPAQARGQRRAAQVWPSSAPARRPSALKRALSQERLYVLLNSESDVPKGAAGGRERAALWPPTQDPPGFSFCVPNRGVARPHPLAGREGLRRAKISLTAVLQSADARWYPELLQ
uniref:Uncharacterized protein n=1 Tax=Sphaerodactylus townsendi TaxID=933632 RepID=A0ACB8GC31_9SAUR